MATILRSLARQSNKIIANNFTKKISYRQPLCFISTSNKNKESSTVTESVQPKQSSFQETKAEDDNWISFGYDFYDPEIDAWAKNMVMFIGFTLCICGGGFIFAYFPDHRLKDWAQREAFLELSRREKEGLPPVDFNLIDPAKIDLPSDEELGETDIVV